MDSEVQSIVDRLSGENLDSFRGKRCLITGGAGFIGSWLLDTLVGLGADVRVADNLWRGSRDNLYRADGTPMINLEKQFMCVDLREYHACLSACQNIDVVFHLADIVAGIDFVFANEPFLFRANMLINSNMVAAARETGVEKFIYVGAACSYPKELQARPGGEPLREEQAYPAEPESAYGWSKLMGEYEAELMAKNSSVAVGILRFHNVYGPRTDLSVGRSQVIPSLIRKAIRFPSEEFLVWGSGRQTRSFIYIADIIEALLRVTLRGLGQGPIQIGTAEQTTIADIASKIVRISGKPIQIKFDTNKPEGDGGRSANCEKAARVLDWQPRTSLDDGLAATYRWAACVIQNERRAVA
jgi:GDP-D-mannose 3', 5'-epimerase